MYNTTILLSVEQYRGWQCKVCPEGWAKRTRGLWTDSSPWEHECRQQISWQSACEIMKYFVCKVDAFEGSSAKWTGFILWETWMHPTHSMPFCRFTLFLCTGENFGLKSTRVAKNIRIHPQENTNIHKFCPAVLETPCPGLQSWWWGTSVLTVVQTDWPNY